MVHRAPVTRALVLGGGGIVGLAWETGLVAGLCESGIDLAGADDVIGTSAGSVVGTWVTSGADVPALADEQENAPSDADGAATAGFDPEHVMRALGRWSAIERFRPEDGRELGRLACEAPTMPEELWLAAIGLSLRTRDWPRRFRASAIDTESGDVRLFDEHSGVAIERAVAASCSVPAVFPPVSIDGRRYTDGSLPTSTHAHRTLERSATQVLIIAPFDVRTPGIGGLMDRERRAEAANLRAAGVEVLEILPSAEAVAEMGVNAMDPSMRQAGLRAGRAQGRREAARADLAAWR